MSLVDNERIKLTAGLLNTVAGFSITAGGIGPLIALTYGLSAAADIGPWILAIIIAIWFSGGVGLHFYARRLLGGLKP